MKKYCFGIDIGGTTVKCGLFNVDGEVLDKWEIKTRTENNGENIIADIAETMNAKIAEKGLDKEEIVGAGVGVPGPADEEGNVPVAVNLHWGFVPLSKELSEKTGLAVRVGNDANVAALGEMWKGGAVGYHNVVMVTLGTGVGGGIIFNGNDLIDAQKWYQTVANGDTTPQYYTYSATNVRLQEASIGYTIPRKKLGDVCDITVSIVGRNLWMLYNKAPFDPEAVATTSNYYQGIDYFMMPSLRSIGFNVRVKF